MSPIDWLYGLQHFGVKLGLDNIRALLRILDHPERAYRSVLVAGTNGKGSVAAMLHAMLGAAGVRCGLFTSPHLVRPHERIRIGPDELDDDALRRWLATLRVRIESAVRDGSLECHPSFFEVVTATALCAFREQRVGAAVLEVGLGGRLDATNAVPADVAVIVSIDLDHVKTLGPTLERIAAEKAGVVKPGRPLVTGARAPEALAVLERVCRERGSELVLARRAARCVGAEGDERFAIETERGAYAGLRLSLAGLHQRENARVAVVALERFADAIGVPVDPAAVREGLAAVRWPGRLQWIRGRRDGPDLLLDGAHNPSGVATLADYLRRAGGPRPVAVYGAMQGKLLEAMLEGLAPRVAALVVTRPPVNRAADPEEVAEVARRYVERVEVEPDPQRALDRAAELAGRERSVLVTGSLYLVGEVLRLVGDRGEPGPVSM